MGSLKNVLVTGANGFLGSHLLQELVQQGYRPIAYLRPTSNLWRIDYLKDQYVEFIAESNDEDKIEQLFKTHEIEAVLHTATNYGRNESLSAIMETNVLFPLRLIEIGAKYQLELFINTDTFFGKNNFVLKYLNNYTTSKRILEQLLVNLSGYINVVNLRIEHVYGENDSEQKFVTGTLNKLIANADEIPFTEASQKRDFIYVDDVVNAYLQILQEDVKINGYQEFEVGTGESIAVKDFVLKMAEITAAKSMLNFGAIPTREGEIENSFADTKALRQLGWAPRYNLSAGLNKMYITEKKKYTNEI